LSVSGYQNVADSHSDDFCCLKCKCCCYIHQPALTYAVIRCILVLLNVWSKYLYFVLREL